MNKEQRLNRVLAGLSHTGYTTEIERAEARMLLEEQNQEIDRLNNIINDFNNCYIDVINKCGWMVEHKYLMNDIAIKQCAEEIKDVCKYYINN